MWCLCGWQSTVHKLDLAWINHRQREVVHSLVMQAEGKLKSSNAQGAHLAAYCIVYEHIDDPATFEIYRSQVMPTIEAFGGKFLVRGGKFTALEGDMPFERIAMLEFRDRATAEAWYHSPEYQRILPYRLKATRCQFLVVDGI